MNKQPVYYMQTDPRWADMDYSAPGERTTIGASGCGPTCAAMLIETLTGRSCTPEDACAWALEHGYKACGQGTYYSYFVPQFNAYGIDCRRINGVSVYGHPKAAAHRDALELLQEGWYLIACMGKGLWTNSGHFVVVWREDGKVRINDPASTKPERENGDLDTFKQQVKYYWAIDARKHNGEEEAMTYEQWKAYMERYRAELGALSPSKNWGEQAVRDARRGGISDGTRPRDLITREECMAMVTRGSK